MRCQQLNWNMLLKSFAFNIFVVLKKVIVIFLLLQIASNNAFAEEFIKLPRLFTHYYHHAHEHKDVKDFYDFLHKHYADHQKNDAHSKNHNSDDDDCKLPFKHCGNCCINIHAHVLGFISSYLTADLNVVELRSSRYISENERIESNDLCSIWQPPKLS